MAGSTTTERVYDIKINGAESVNELKAAVEQLNEKLKTLNETSKEYKETLQELAQLQGKLSDAMSGIGGNAGKANDAMKQMKDSTESATESLNDMSRASEKTKESLGSIGEPTTIKELKAEIKSLKAEFANLEIGSEGYINVATQIANEEKRLKAAMQGVKTTVDDTGESYNSLSIKMRQLKEEYHSTNDEARRNELAPQIAELQQRLKDMDAAVLVYGRNVGNYGSALSGLSGSFTNLRQELKACKEAMQQMDPASQEYSDALARAAEITHQLSDQQEQIKYSSTDIGDQLSNMQGIASNLAAGYSAINAAMGLMGEESEDVQQAMLKIQQAMALVQGLQGLDGLIKRTQGLSTAMKAWIGASKASAAATKANAAASAQDAAAKGAEATATAGAVAPQLALNAAMAANPIGVILTAIGALVALFVIFKDKIKELIGSNKEMSAAFDKVKAVLSGFGNVIKKSIINPIKMAIIPIKTLAKVMIDLFKGDWTAIGDDLKAGFDEMKNTVVDTINVVGAFKEGYDKKTAEQNEAARKAEAAARQKEIDDIIKDNEAKYGSDWKYTEEAKKLYEEMFKVRMAQYKDDSDEYREAQRDKMAYDREYAAKQKEAQDKANEEQKKRAEQWAKEEEQRRKKELSDFKSSFSKFIPEWTQMSISIQDMYYKWGKGVDEFRESMIETLSEYKKNLLGVDALTKKQIKDIKSEVEDIISSMEVNFNKDIMSGWAKMLRESYEKEFYNWDRAVSSWLSEEKTRFENEKLTLGLELPEDALRHFNDIFEKQSANIKKEIKRVDEDIKAYREQLNSVTERYREHSDEQLGLEIPEFQKMLDKKLELEGKYNQVRIDNFKATSDVISNEYEKAEAKDNTYYENRLRSAEQWYSQNEALFEKEQQMYMGGNEIEMLKRQEDYENRYFSSTMEMYEKMRDRYQAMSNDMTLTAEARAEAERSVARVTGQMVEAEMDHQTQLLKIQRDNIKAWQNAVKDSVSAVSDILSSIGDSWNNLIDIEKDEINQQLENGQITEEEAKRRQDINKESFENLKKLQVAQAIINTLAAAVSAYQSMASIPYVGPALGAAAAAAALAAGYAQVRQIQSTDYDSGGSTGSSGYGGGSSSSTNFQLPNVLDLEPDMGRNLTGQDDTDVLNNNGRGRGETAIKTYVLESDVDAAQKLARKRSQEVSF